MVRCGFTISNVIWPFLFEEMHDSGFESDCVIGGRYEDMLQNSIISIQADKHLLESATFMQDGAPPHIPREVKDLLLRSFSEDRFLSQHFRYAWPPVSPDANPCDYCSRVN